ncbi:MAG TPA: hypothetical protein VH164_09625 [Ktedonobacteraceae bacterium]|nr:hypothetical protein [Ktedonobacteraceae bacterium]
MNEQSPKPALFNPNEHLMQIKSRNGAADYLPVQWRLVWFRSLCPNGSIETEIVHLDLDRETEEETFAWNSETRRSEKVVKRAPGFAVFRATVKDGRGGVAIGTKSEKAASFGDFIEKAETGSIGRALAALGYGTQFTGDEFDERHRIVDAPVDRTTSASAAENGAEQQSAPAANAKPVVSAVGSGRVKAVSNGHQKLTDEVDPRSPVTEQQWSSIRKLCQHLGKAEPQSTDTMNYLAAKELIAQLTQEYRQSRSKAS